MTYSASAKENLLDIPKKIIIENGVVSEATAKWMAERTRIKMDTDFGVSFTGVAGPDTLEEIRRNCLDRDIAARQADCCF